MKLVFVPAAVDGRGNAALTTQTPVKSQHPHPPQRPRQHQIPQLISLDATPLATSGDAAPATAPVFTVEIAVQTNYCSSSTDVTGAFFYYSFLG